MLLRTLSSMGLVHNHSSPLDLTERPQAIAALQVRVRGDHNCTWWHGSGQYILCTGACACTGTEHLVLLQDGRLVAHEARGGCVDIPLYSFRLCLTASLEAFSPPNMTVARKGHHLLSSCAQLSRVLLGATTKCGPALPRHTIAGVQARLTIAAAGFSSGDTRRTGGVLAGALALACACPGVGLTSIPHGPFFFSPV